MTVGMIILSTDKQLGCRTRWPRGNRFDFVIDKFRANEIKRFGMRSNLNEKLEKKSNHWGYGMAARASGMARWVSAT